MGFHVCPTCAVGLVNDDWSALKATFDTGNVTDDALAYYKARAHIDGLLELTGPLVHVREEDKGGYYDCPCCGEIAIGTAHVFQPII